MREWSAYLDADRRCESRTQLRSRALDRAPRSESKDGGSHHVFGIVVVLFGAAASGTSDQCSTRTRRREREDYPRRETVVTHHINGRTNRQTRSHQNLPSDVRAQLCCVVG